MEAVARSEPDALSPLGLRMVRVDEIPRALLEQKRGLDVERLQAAADLGAPLWAFLALEAGEPIACWVCARAAWTQGLLIDTLIVDRERRTDERVGAVLRLALRSAETLARSLGESLVTWSTDRPDRMRELIGDDRVRPAETTLALRVDGGA